MDGCWSFSTMYNSTEDGSIFQSSESAMQAAGCNPSNIYRDLRSARRAHQRTRKYPRRVPRDAGYCKQCSDVHCHNSRLARVKDIKPTMRYKDWEGEFADGIQDYFDLNMALWEARYDEWQREENAVEFEDFGVWGRRRIMEMRAVKEERLRAVMLQNSAPGIPDAVSQALTQDMSASIPSTTLPTSPSDIAHHLLLESMVNPSPMYLRRWRREGKAPFRIIEGFAWFNKHATRFHRNYSGCWEFAEGDCNGPNLPCGCCGTARYHCSCKDFDKEIPSPEDTPSCSLVEWADARLRELLKEEPEERIASAVKYARLQLEWEWETVSDAISMDWDVVSDISEFDDIA